METRTEDPVARSVLTDSLTAAGHRVETIGTTDSGIICILPHGGRVIGLFANSFDDNFLWTNPQLATASSAMDFFASADWTNSGGDRTWLGPELDHFYPVYPDTSVYVQPRQLDPGNFRVLDCDEPDACRMESVLELASGRSHLVNRITISKTVKPARNPLGTALHRVDYAGYSQTTGLRLETLENSFEVNVWNLLQLPHGGEMVISTFCASEPTVFFGDIPNDAISVTEQAIRYRMDSDGEQKISARANVCVGRVGYRLDNGELHTLVVRNFAVHPSAVYLDAPVGDENDIGYAVQACNISNSELGSYAEMEYHAPAIGGATGIMAGADHSEVWAFRGSSEAIDEVTKRLLRT